MGIFEGRHEESSIFPSGEHCTNAAKWLADPPSKNGIRMGGPVSDLRRVLGPDASPDAFFSFQAYTRLSTVGTQPR